jgi:hypothetical protein
MVQQRVVKAGFGPRRDEKIVVVTYVLVSNKRDGAVTTHKGSNALDILTVLEAEQEHLRSIAKLLPPYLLPLGGDEQGIYGGPGEKTLPLLLRPLIGIKAG